MQHLEAPNQPVQLLFINMTGEDQCALNLDGTLKDPSEINWYESEGDDQPIGTRTTNRAAGKLLVHCPQSIAHQSLFLLGLQQQSLHGSLHQSHIIPAQSGGKYAQKHKRTDTITSKMMVSKPS